VQAKYNATTVDLALANLVEIMRASFGYCFDPTCAGAQCTLCVLVTGAFGECIG
jgi:hypothetical protein